MLSKRYESTEVDRRTWLHVPSGTHWSISSDTLQLVEIYPRADPGLSRECVLRIPMRVVKDD